MSTILGNALITPELADRVLRHALSSGGQFAEIFCEERSSFSLAIDESRVERAQSGRECGAGIRVVAGDSTHFAHVDGLGEAELTRAAAAVAAARRDGHAQPRLILPAERPDLQLVELPPVEVETSRKADLLRTCDETARSTAAEVAQVQASYAEGQRRITIVNSEGLHTSDERTRVRLGVQVVARRGEVVETGMETLGGHRGFELLDGGAAEETARGAAEKALALLDASPAPAGPMPVVVGSGFGGVLFHEMTGHGLEADAVQKGASVYAGKLGKQVAEPIVTAYDDGRLPGEWGTNAIDDEGTPSRRTALIEEGKLSSYLYDLMRARRDGVAPTGNGRRQSFRHLPIPRMTNTYIEPGVGEPPDLISEIDRGFYAVSFAGGQVEPATGNFVFGVSEGYLIEGGKVTSPCRGATLIGNSLAALAAIDAVASDFDVRTGFCGKDGQRVPVGTGQGHVRIRELTVGGTAL